MCFLQSELSRDVLFFIPLSAKTPSFESISGRPSSKKALKNRCFRLEGYKKVEKTLHRSEVRAFFAVKTRINARFGIHPAVSGGRPGIRGSPAKWSQEPLVGGPLPTRHGQDDGSLTNSLKLLDVGSDFIAKRSERQSTLQKPHLRQHTCTCICLI